MKIFDAGVKVTNSVPEKHNFFILVRLPVITISKVTNYYLPSVYMHIIEDDRCGRTGEKLKTTLGVFYTSNTKEPHQEVKAVHQKRTENGTLKKKRHET